MLSTMWIQKIGIFYGCTTEGLKTWIVPQFVIVNVQKLGIIPGFEN